MYDILSVTLFEDRAGRLLLVAEAAPPPVTEDGALLRIGRARIPAHHLAPAVVERLLARGHVRVDGPDALNVLLAFADATAQARP